MLPRILVLALVMIAVGRPAAGQPEPTAPLPIPAELVMSYVAAPTDEAREQIIAGSPLILTGEFRLALQRLGLQRNAAGDRVTALRAYDAAIDLARRANSPRSQAAALIGLSQIQGQAADYAAAAGTLTAALALAETIGDREMIASAANNLGNVYRRRGEPDLALAQYERALAFHEADRRVEAAARTLNNIGLVHQQQWNSRLALDYFVRSLALKEKFAPPDEMLSTLTNIGSLYAQQNNGPVAIEYFSRVLALADRVGNVRAVVSTLNNMGYTYLNENRVTEAEASFSQGLALAEKTGSPGLTAKLLSHLGTVAIERRQWAVARDRLERSHAQFEASGDPIGAGEALSELARLDLEQGHFAAAMPTVLRSRALLESTGTPVALSAVHYMEGRLHEQLGHPADAIASFERAITLGERARELVAGGTEDRVRFFEERVDPYYGLANLYAATGRASEAFAAVERARARGLLDVMAAGQWADLEPAFVRRDAPAVSPEDLAAMLPAKTAVVEFATGPNKSWAFLITGGTGQPVVSVTALKVDREKLDRLADAFSRQIASRNLGFVPAARELYDVLLGPIDARLRDIDHVIVVPHGALWKVPFQALQTPRRRYVIEERAVSYAPSASALRQLLLRRRSAPANPRVVAFGDPWVVSAPGQNPAAPDLPNAAREVRKVAASYGHGRAVVAVAVEASESRFRELAPTADIVHIATHGVLDDDSPLDSHVVLAGTHGAGPRGDGRLDGREFLNLRLQAELVVLSACETARGHIVNGEGVLGMSWALLAAGTSTAAVSLWRVDSASTTDLMTAFHRERQLRRSATAASAQAMRSAQRSLLARPEYRHPFYWAGFVVVGVP